MRFLFAAALAVGFSAPSAHAEVLVGSAPITGKMAWFGEQHQRAVDMAVAEINKAGGLLGETAEIVVADDYCDAEQAVAAANKLIAQLLRGSHPGLQGVRGCRDPDDHGHGYQPTYH